MDPSGDLNVTFTPNDMMRLMQSKFVEAHYDDLAVEAVKAAEALVYKRDIDTATRRRLAAEGHALPNLSYPIENTGDLQNAAVLARSGHGDVAAARRLIAREARERGVANPLDESDEVKKSSSEVRREPMRTALEPVTEGPPTASARARSAQRTRSEGRRARSAAKEAEPELTKDPEPEDQAEARQEGQEAEEAPPVAEQAEGRRRRGERLGLQRRRLQAWITRDTEKCHTTPAEAAGVSGTHDDAGRPGPRAAGDASRRMR